MHKNKFINRSLYAVLTVGVSSALFSCQNDMHEDIAGNESDIVSFCIDKSSWGDIADTRSGSHKDTHEIDRAVLRSAGSNDSLCIRAIESDGIDLGPSVSTRGSSIGDVSELSSFGCFAYTEQSGYKFYINNEEYSKGSDGKFTSENIYYWPGVQQNLSLDFYCYAPYNCNGLTVPSVASESGTRFLEYAVPKDVSKQQDLMLAEGVNGTELKGCPGDYNQVLDLSFKHLLSAVRIETGSSMQAGTIKSITFSNLYGSANIDMDNPTAWSGHSDYKSFTFAPEGGVQVTGTNDQEIMAGANTMLMLPQAMQPETSLDPTMLTVVFNDGTGSQDRELTAELSGEWQMGRTYTYKLSITPEYELEFTQDNPTEVDAHYGIIPIKIKANELKEGWTVTSDQSWATLKTKLTPFEQQGYWLDNTGDYPAYCNDVNVPVERTQQITGNVQGEEVEFYLFLSENSGSTDRQVTLSVRPSDNSDAAPSTLSITQKCPNWSGDIGWEQIEEPINNDRPFGFQWKRKVTLRSSQKMGGVEAWFYKMWLRTGGGLDIIFPAKYPDFVTNIDAPSVWTQDYLTIDLDYSKINNVTNASDVNNGLLNSYNLYNFSGGTTLTTETMLINNYGFIITDENGVNTTVGDYAAAICIRKNKFKIVENSESGRKSFALNPLTQNDIKWYLPASGQFANIPSDMKNKEYWSSTAINDNTNANAYSWNGSPIITDRMALRNVRAVRVKD